MPEETDQTPEKPSGETRGGEPAKKGPSNLAIRLATAAVGQGPTLRSAPRAAGSLDRPRRR